MIDRLSSLKLDPGSDLGIAGQIRARIGLLMADGELEPGSRLPSVRSLAEQLGINVNTVRAAYARLEADGLVETRHGLGTIVLPRSAEQLVLRSPPLGSNTVAVLIAGLDPFYLSLLRAIEDVAAEQGTLVMIADTRDSSPLASAIIRRLSARGVDGIIAVSVGGVDAGMRERGRRGRKAVPPIVHVDQPDRQGYSIVFDGEQAGYIATRHLGEHGHESIGFVTAPLSLPNAKEIYSGYARALEEVGARPLVSEVEAFTVAAGRKGLVQLLDQAHPPTAVFATAEVLALGVLQEARSRGMDVPEDLAMIGYTDSPAAALVEPPLTMVSVPSRESGVQAMRMLQALLLGKKPRPPRTVLEVELVIRRSCGWH